MAYTSSTNNWKKGSGITLNLIKHYCRYFTQKAARQKKDVDDDISETESVSDSEFDSFLGKS